MITTLIPTFNRSSLLQRAIQSILNQTFQNFTIIVSDNASTDETEKVVKSYQDPRIRYIRHEKNVGLFQNFSSLLSCVKTEFFSFLSDDDYLLPWFYETALEDHKKFPEIGFSASRTMHIDQKGNLLPYQFYHSTKQGYYTSKARILQLIQYEIPLWTGILYHQKVLEKVPCLNPNVGILFDNEFTLKCAHYYPFCINSKPSAVYVSWSGTTSNQSFSSFQPTIFNYFESIHNLPNLSKDLKQKFNKEFNLILKRHLRIWWLNAIIRGNYKESVTCQNLLNENGEKNLSKYLTYINIATKVVPLRGAIFKMLRKLRHRLKVKPKIDFEVRQTLSYLQKSK